MTYRGPYADRTNARRGEKESQTLTACRAVLMGAASKHIGSVEANVVSAGFVLFRERHRLALVRVPR